MASHRQSVAILTRLDVALRQLRDGIEPVPPRDVPVAEALGCVAAQMPAVTAWPPRHLAMVDGWALRSADIVGASTYSPVLLPAAPAWLEAGTMLPCGCDCVIDVDRVTQAGTRFQAVSEAVPGEGIRRAGEDVSPVAIVVAGRRIGPRDLALARTLDMASLAVRRPRVHILNIEARDGRPITALLIAEQLRCEGAEAVVTEAARNAEAIVDALDTVSAQRSCELLLLVGGTGCGRTDAAIVALAARGAIFAHGLALRPGRTAALGRLGKIPVVALPGAPVDALALWWSVVEPLVCQLTGACPPPSQRLPLTRKIASTVGMAELVMLARRDEGWTPLAIGDIPLEVLARADAWLCVPDDSEGYAAGTAVDARCLRDRE